MNPLTSLKQASHAHKLPFWVVPPDVWEKKGSGFTASLTNFRVNATLPVLELLSFQLRCCSLMNGSPIWGHSMTLIGSDDICLPNNWFKSTCWAWGTWTLSQSHLSWYVCGKSLPEAVFLCVVPSDILQRANTCCWVALKIYIYSDELTLVSRLHTY